MSQHEEGTEIMDRMMGCSGALALWLLEDRFARGEIDRDESEERCRTLRP